MVISKQISIIEAPTHAIQLSEQNKNLLNKFTINYIIHVFILLFNFLIGKLDKLLEKKTKCSDKHEKL